MSHPVPPPMLCSSSAVPPDGDGWAVEPKWDGFRALVRCQDGRTSVFSRSLHDRTSSFPELSPMAQEVGRDVVLDGELVAFGDDGRPDFWRVWNRGFATGLRAREAARQSPVTFVAFDVLEADGTPLVGRPYVERRQLLDAIGLDGSHWAAPSAQVGDVSTFFAAACELGLEGVVAKELSGRYRPGVRTSDWVKVKNVVVEDLHVAGWLLEGGMYGHGGLLVGRPREDGPGLVPCGVVEVGSRAGWRQLALGFIGEAVTDRCPFVGTWRPAEAIYTNARIIASVQHLRTDRHLIRHAVARDVFVVDGAESAAARSARDAVADQCKSDSFVSATDDGRDLGCALLPDHVFGNQELAVQVQVEV